MSGVNTTILPASNLIDDLIGNHQGSTRRITVERLVALLAALMGPTYATRAQLYADLSWPAGAIGYVREDGNSAFNGVYRKAGAVGAGTWTRIGSLPSGAVEQAQIDALVAAVDEKADRSSLLDEVAARVDAIAVEASARQQAEHRGDVLALTNIGGSGDAVTADRRPEQAHITTWSGSLLRVQWPAANTASDPTLAIDGGGDLPVKRYDGDAIRAGEMVAGKHYLLWRWGTQYRLASPSHMDEITALPETLAAKADSVEMSLVGALPLIEVGGKVVLWLDENGDLASSGLSRSLQQSAMDGSFLDASPASGLPLILSGENAIAWLDAHGNFDSAGLGENLKRSAAATITEEVSVHQMGIPLIVVGSSVVLWLDETGDLQWKGKTDPTPAGPTQFPAVQSIESAGGTATSESYSEFASSSFTADVKVVEADVAGYKVAWIRDDNGPIGPTDDGGMWKPWGQITPLHFGATASNTGNDAPAVQAAVDYAGTIDTYPDPSFPKVKGSVFLPSGIYLFAAGSTVTIPRGVSIHGESRSATLIRHMGGDVDCFTTDAGEVSNTNVAFRDFSLRGVGTTRCGIRITGGYKNCELHNVTIRDCKVNLGGDRCWTLLVHHCNFDRAVDYNVHFGNLTCATFFENRMDLAGIANVFINGGQSSPTNTSHVKFIGGSYQYAGEAGVRLLDVVDATFIATYFEGNNRNSGGHADLEWLKGPLNFGRCLNLVDTENAASGGGTNTRLLKATAPGHISFFGPKSYIGTAPARYAVGVETHSDVKSLTLIGGWIDADQRLSVAPETKLTDIAMGAAAVSVPGPFVDDAAAAAAGVRVKGLYHKADGTTSVRTS